MTAQRTAVLGVPVDAVNMQTALESVRAMLASNRNHLIFAVNPEKIMAAQESVDLRQALEHASLLIPDGIGAVVAARILNGVKMERVPGSDLMPAICQLAATEGHSIFMFGARPSVADEAAGILKKRFPTLRVAGTQDGYVKEKDMGALIERINASGAAILFVGLGSPKQELWLDRFRTRLSTRVCQGVGGTFDAICGRPKRAPQIVRRLHLEWLHRLMLQPNRANRQSALPRFVWAILAQKMTRLR